jgi:hypothetical protein
VIVVVLVTFGAVPAVPNTRLRGYVYPTLKVAFKVTVRESVCTRNGSNSIEELLNTSVCPPSDVKT